MRIRLISQKCCLGEHRKQPMAHRAKTLCTIEVASVLAPHAHNYFDFIQFN